MRFDVNLPIPIFPAIIFSMIKVKLLFEGSEEFNHEANMIGEVSDEVLLRAAFSSYTRKKYADGAPPSRIIKATVENCSRIHEEEYNKKEIMDILGIT